MTAFFPGLPAVTPLSSYLPRAYNKAHRRRGTGQSQFKVRRNVSVDETLLTRLSSGDSGFEKIPCDSTAVSQVKIREKAIRNDFQLRYSTLDRRWLIQFYPYRQHSLVMSTRGLLFYNFVQMKLAVILTET